MNTLVKKIDSDSLALAKSFLESGELVAFPTETVYGLGADARSDEAVARIYVVKGRPSDNPLIVHVHKDYDIASLVSDVQPYVAKLREAFLPGPLTLVYPSRGKVSARVSCGLDTLAVRVPSHPGAQEFLRYTNIPVAAPSANLSKHVSPVSVEHVLADLGGRIPLILDGGRCSGGIESTVCDVTGPIPHILREGLITREMIAGVVGCCEVYVPKEGEQVRSPGMKYKHYAPTCETKLFSHSEIKRAKEYLVSQKEAGKRTAVLCESEEANEFPGENVLDLGKTPREMAANLYGLLREAEKVADVLVAICPEREDDVMAGVLNRLKKACAESR